MAADVDERANRQVEELFKALKPSELASLMTGLKTYGRIMGLHVGDPASVRIRPHRIGDASYMTFLHGTLYSQEYGLDATFEVEVGRGITEFVDQFDPQWDGFWVAEVAPATSWVVSPSSLGVRNWPSCAGSSCTRPIAALGWEESS